MKLLRRFAPPLTILALALVGLEAILQPSLPCSDDAAFHLLRLTQLDHLLRQGILYSRWAPDMAQGYGYPFFNFYAPLSTYITAFIGMLTQNLNLAVRVSFALSFYLSGVMAYLLARDHFSKIASLVTAVSFMYAPYLAYDILFRGNLAETMAWPLMPLALWSMGRLARGGGRRYFLATTISYASILLMHNVFALIFSPLLGLYGIINLSFPRRRESTSSKTWIPAFAGMTSETTGRFILISTALLLGLGITTFFWLPALIERAMVHSDRLLVPPVFVYWGNFVTLSEIFIPPPTIYSDLLNPSPARALGLVPLLLALPAVFLGWRRKRQEDSPATRHAVSDYPLRVTYFFAGATAVYTVLMLSISTPVWENLPLIEFVQFPWRLLGPAALTLAMLVGATIDLLPRSPAPLRPVTAAAFITLLILSNLYFLDARYCPGLESPTIADMQAFERDSSTIGTTAKGEYLPLTVHEMPPEPATEPFAPLPDGASISAITHHPLHLTAAVTAAEPFTLTANIFDYAGWQAMVDGAPVPITASDRYGLISLPVPAGEHTVEIDFGSTPLRKTAVFISILSLAALLFIAWKLPIIPMQFAPSTLSWWGYGSIVLLAFGLLFISPHLTRARLPNLGDEAAFANGMHLREYTIARRTMPADDTLAIRAFWQAAEPQSDDFRDTIRLVDSDGLAWSANTSGYPRLYRAPLPTTMWPTDSYADILHDVTALPATPPGLYQIQLILFNKEGLTTVPLADGERAFGERTLILGTVQLERPEETPTIEPQFEADGRWGNVSLIGYNLDRQEAAPGDPFLLTTFWQADGEMADMNAILSLVDEDGAALFTQSFAPVHSDFPTSQWQDGDLWRGQRPFRLPVALESGVYEWQICLTNDETCEAISLNTLTITAPDRVFTPPPVTIDTRNEAFAKSPVSEPVAILEGVNVLENNGVTEITAVWQATDQSAANYPPVSYRVFVHLLDADGNLIAQSDGEPANWTRPTTGWMAGEFISDTHTLNSVGETILIGLYDPETGERLVLKDGKTAVLIMNNELGIINNE